MQIIHIWKHQKQFLIIEDEEEEVQDDGTTCKSADRIDRINFP